MSQPSPITHGDSWSQFLISRYNDIVAVMWKEDRNLVRRIHCGKASVYADLLARYYYETGSQQKGRLWAERSARYHRRAFHPARSIVKNIGAEMP